MFWEWKHNTHSVLHHVKTVMIKNYVLGLQSEQNACQIYSYMWYPSKSLEIPFIWGSSPVSQGLNLNLL